MENKKSKNKSKKDEFYKDFTELEGDLNPFSDNSPPNQDIPNSNEKKNNQNNSKVNNFPQNSEENNKKPDLKKDFEDAINIAGESIKKGFRTIGEGFKKGINKIAEKIEQTSEEFIEKQREKQESLKRKTDEEFQNLPEASSYEDYKFDENSEFIKQMNTFSSADLNEDSSENQENYQIKNLNPNRIYSKQEENYNESENNKNITKKSIPKKKNTGSEIYKVEYGDIYTSQAEKSALSYIQQIAEGKKPKNEILNGYKYLSEENYDSNEIKLKSYRNYWRTQLFSLYSDLISKKKKKAIYILKIKILIKRFLKQLDNNSKNLELKKEISEIFNIEDLKKRL